MSENLGWRPSAPASAWPTASADGTTVVWRPPDEPPDSLGQDTPRLSASVTWGQTWTSTPWASLLELAETGSEPAQVSVQALQPGNSSSWQPQAGAGPGAWWEGLRLLGQAQGRPVLARQARRVQGGPGAPRTKSPARSHAGSHAEVPGVAVSSLSCGRVLLEAPTCVPCLAPVPAGCPEPVLDTLSSQHLSTLGWRPAPERPPWWWEQPHLLQQARLGGQGQGQHWTRAAWAAGALTSRYTLDLGSRECHPGHLQVAAPLTLEAEEEGPANRAPWGQAGGKDSSRQRLSETF